MTRTEIITRLCEMVAEITDIRENHLPKDEWQADASLREVAVRLQLVMKQMQEGGQK